MATFLFHISIVMFLVSKTLAFLLLIVSIVISFSALFTYVRLTLEKKKKMDGPA